MFCGYMLTTYVRTVRIIITYSVSHSQFLSNVCAYMPAGVAWVSLAVVTIPEKKIKSVKCSLNSSFHDIRYTCRHSNFLCQCQNGGCFNGFFHSLWISPLNVGIESKGTYNPMEESRVPLQVPKNKIQLLPYFVLTPVNMAVAEEALSTTCLSTA